MANIYYWLYYLNDSKSYTKICYYFTLYLVKCIGGKCSSKDFIFKFQSYRLLDLMIFKTLGCNIVVGGLGWAVDPDILGSIP